MSPLGPAPSIGAPGTVRFPAIERAQLANGLDVWSMPRLSSPVVTVLLLVNCGSANDPDARPGLAGVTADLMDEGAGDKGAIELSEAFARLGSYLELEVGPDVTTFGMTTLSRHFEAVVDLLGDVMLRPRLADADFARVRDLRLSRLRQLSRSASSAADRAFLDAVFPGHPYGHGALGTSPSLDAVTADEARAFWNDAFVPSGATLIAVGDVSPEMAVAAGARAFGAWGGRGVSDASAPAKGRPPERRVLLVDRPGATQSELRVGHAGPARRSEAYHPLVTMNAVLGGQFASRINRTLREERGVTYGARTAFEFRRAGGNFACETSVQADATADSVTEILRQFEEIGRDGAVDDIEIDRAKSSLTRGYVRNFETAVQLARASAHLATHDLPASVYDDFVPEIGGVTGADLTAAARRYVRPEDSAVVVVGDAARCREPLEQLGREVVIVAPEF
jgi:zinc protease